MTATLTPKANKDSLRNRNEMSSVVDRSYEPYGFEAGDANLYRYVGNKATYFVDPSGLGEAIYPFNSAVCNFTNKPLWVYPGSTGKGEWIGPGGTSPIWDNGDFYMDKGQWYKVPGMGVGGLGPNGKPFLICPRKGYFGEPMPYNGEEGALPIPPWMKPGPPMQPKPPRLENPVIPFPL